MAESLWISTAVLAGDKVFFLTEQEGYLGRIDLSTRKVDFLSEIPDDIIGQPAHEKQLFYHYNDIYIMSNNGSYVYKYRIDENRFDILYQELDGGSAKSCAGKWMNEDGLYIFSRMGEVISWSIKENCLVRSELIKGREVAWISGFDDIVWMLDKDSFDMYKYDVLNDKCYKYQNNIMNGLNTKSKSWLPIHYMKAEEGKVYILDAEKVYEYNTNNRRIKIIYQSRSCDNGSRLIVTSETIVIPPFSGDEFKVINRSNGKFIKSEKIPDMDSCAEGNEMGSTTGALCEGKDIVYMPIVNKGNLILGINKEKTEFSWISVSIGHKDKNNMMIGIINKAKIVNEHKYLSLNDYLNFLEKR